MIIEGAYEVAVAIREQLYDLMCRLSSTDPEASETTKHLYDAATDLAEWVERNT